MAVFSDPPFKTSNDCSGARRNLIVSIGDPTSRCPQKITPRRHPAAQRSCHRSSDVSKWLKDVSLGNQIAFYCLYKAVSARLFRIAFRITHDHNAAEDVLQDIFVSIWLKSSKFDPSRGSASAWLAAVARSRAIDRIRQKARTPTTQLNFADMVVDTSPRADAILVALDDNRRMHAAISQLKPVTAAIIRDIYFDGLTCEAAAGRAGVPLNTAKSLNRRGLMQLRTIMTLPDRSDRFAPGAQADIPSRRKR